MAHIDVLLHGIAGLSQDLGRQLGLLFIRDKDRGGDEGDFQRLFDNSAQTTPPHTRISTFRVLKRLIARTEQRLTCPTRARQNSRAIPRPRNSPSPASRSPQHHLRPFAPPIRANRISAQPIHTAADMDQWRRRPPTDSAIVSIYRRSFTTKGSSYLRRWGRRSCSSSSIYLIVHNKHRQLT